MRPEQYQLVQIGIGERININKTCETATSRAPAPLRPGKVKERRQFTTGAGCVLNYGVGALIIIARRDQAVTYKFITWLAFLTQPSRVPRITCFCRLARARTGSRLYLCNDTSVSSYRPIRRSVIR